MSWSWQLAQRISDILKNNITKDKLLKQTQQQLQKKQAEIQADLDKIITSPATTGSELAKQAERLKQYFLDIKAIVANDEVLRDEMLSSMPSVPTQPITSSQQNTGKQKSNTGKKKVELV
jgi:hypothetical protein